MSAIQEWLRRVWYLLNRSRFDHALRSEMEAHRAMMADPARFGNTLRLREDARDVWGWAWLDDLIRDLRFAARTLARSPGVSCVAIASLLARMTVRTREVVTRAALGASPLRLVRQFLAESLLMSLAGDRERPHLAYHAAGAGS